MKKLLLSILFVSHAQGSPCLFYNSVDEALSNIEGADNCEEAVRSTTPILKKQKQERIDLIEKRLANAVINSTRENFKDIVRTDYLANLWGEGIQGEDTHSKCRFDRISEELNCPSTYTKKRIKKLFNEDGVESLLTKIKEGFKSDLLPSKAIDQKACFSNDEKGKIISLVNRQTYLEGNLTALKGLLKNPDAWKLLKEGKGLEEIYEETALEEAQILKVGLAHFPMLKSLLKTPEGISLLGKQLEKFSKGQSNDEMIKILKDLYKDKKASSLLSNNLSRTCDKFVSNLKTFICSPPKSEGVKNDIFNDVAFGFSSPDHEYGFDELMTPNPEDKKLIGEHYEHYLYQCMGQVCSEEKPVLSICYQKGPGFDTEAFIGDLIQEHDGKVFQNSEIFKKAHLQKADSFEKNLCPYLACENGHEVVNQAKECKALSPKRTIADLEKYLPCPKDSFCQNEDYLLYKNLQEEKAEVQKKIQSRLAKEEEQSEESNGVTLKKPEILYSQFMTNFLGVPTAPAQAAKVEGIAEKEKAPVSKETLAKVEKGDTEVKSDPAQEPPRKESKTQAVAGNLGQQFNQLQNFTKAAAVSNKSSDDKIVKETREIFKNIISGYDRLNNNTLQALSDANERLQEERKAPQGKTKIIERVRSPKKQRLLGDLDNYRKDNSNPYGTIDRTRLINDDEKFVAPKKETEKEDEGDTTVVIIDKDSPETGETPTAGKKGVKGSKSAKGRAAASSGGGASSGNSVTTSLSGLSSLNTAQIKSNGVNPEEPFVILVKIQGKVIAVPVRPFVYRGKEILAPVLDEENHGLLSQLKLSPIFKQYFEFQKQRKQIRRDFHQTFDSLQAKN